MNYNDLLLKLQIRYSTLNTSDRFKRLDILERFLKGNQYEDLHTPFYQTFSSMVGYVPIRQRKPSVNYNIPKILVDRSVDMLFGDKHFPEVHVENRADQDTEKILKTLIRESFTANKFKQAAKMGSVGSVFVLFKFVDGKLYNEVWNTKFCTLEYHPRIPGEIIRVNEERLVYGDELLPFGYNVDPQKQYVYRRSITTEEEIEYFPVEFTSDLMADGLKFNRPNPERSFKHNFGFVPGVWIRNLDSEDPVDGESTFEALLDIQIEIDYQISQLGRVFHYTGDPTLLIKDSAFDDEEGASRFGNQVGNTLILNNEGDAKYIEISGQAQETNIKWIEKLRSFAMEIGRGNRVNPEKLNAAQSGKALALLHKDIIGLVSELRMSYGDQGLLLYLRKVLKAYSMMETDYPELKGLKPNPDAHIVLRWGDYFEDTSEDDRAQFDALKTGIEAGIISQARATKRIADRFDIEDPDAEREVIKEEKAEQMKQIAALDQTQQVSMKMKSNHI